MYRRFAISSIILPPPQRRNLALLFSYLTLDIIDTFPVIIHASCTRANQIWQVEMAKREEERKQEEERKREERKIQEEERKKKLEEKEGKEEVDD